MRLLLNEVAVTIGVIDERMFARLKKDLPEMHLLYREVVTGNTGTAKVREFSNATRSE